MQWEKVKPKGRCQCHASNDGEGQSPNYLFHGVTLFWLCRNCRNRAKKSVIAITFWSFSVSPSHSPCALLLQRRHHCAALARIVCAGQSRERSSRNGCYNEQRFLSAAFGASTINSKELNMTALQGWIVIGLLVLIMLGIVGIGVELKDLPYLWRTDAPNADLER
jgi:hypothetical protein